MGPGPGLIGRTRSALAGLLGRRGETRAGSWLGADSDAVAILLPSLGFFSGVDAGMARVTVTGPIRGVRVALAPGGAAPLDLRGLAFAKDGRRVEPDRASVTFRQSSEAATPIDPARALTWGGLRTGSETAPWWSMLCDPPVDLDEIRVLNRMDGLGYRNRRLRVAVLAASGEWTTIADLRSDAVVRRTLALLTRLTGLALDTAAAADPAAVRTEVLRALAERTRSGPLTDDADEQRLLYALIPTGTAKSHPSWTDDEWRLTAHLLAAERLRYRDTATSFRSFSYALDTRAALDRLAAEVTTAGAVLGLGELLVTRHGIREPGALRRRSADYLALMARITEVFAELGKPLMLAYGTLLGAVREGDFLAHDDDVDMMYPLDATDRDDARPLIDALCEQLQERERQQQGRGWRIWRNESPTALNLHLTDPKSGLHVDLFPALVHGDEVALHMEKMKLRSIPRSIVVPAAPLTFRDRELLGPADPEAFLGQRYGDDWDVSDPYHDWLWPLQPSPAT